MKFVKFILFPSLCGIVLGLMIANLTKDVNGLSWLAFGSGFGTSSPLMLDLGIFQLTFGVYVTINVATILCVVICLLIAKRMFKR